MVKKASHDRSSSYPRRSRERATNEREQSRSRSRSRNRSHRMSDASHKRKEGERRSSSVGRRRSRSRSRSSQSRWKPEAGCPSHSRAERSRSSSTKRSIVSEEASKIREICSRSRDASNEGKRDSSNSGASTSSCSPRKGSDGVRKTLEDRARKRRRASPSSSPSSSPSRSSSSSSTSTSGSDSDLEDRKKKKRKENCEKRKLKKLKKSKRVKIKSLQSVPNRQLKVTRNASLGTVSFLLNAKEAREKLLANAPAISVVTEEVIKELSKRVIKPMTEEEWQKSQSVIRKAVSPSGRTRLVRGDGEILEEIVSRTCQKETTRLEARTGGQQFKTTIYYSATVLKKP